MGRRHRNFRTNGIYHVIQRGHNKSFVFDDQLDKAQFVDIIRVTLAALPCNLLYYVLMDNHFHLILEMTSDPIDVIMQRISMTYSKYYNKKYSRSGSVYGERYRSYPISDRAYLIQLIRYIANNPVKAGIVTQLSDYRWCADMEIRAKRCTILSRKRLFEVIGGSDERGRAVYQRLIKQKIELFFHSSTQREFIQDCHSESVDALLLKTLDGGALVEHVRSASRDAHVVKLRHEFIKAASEKGYTSKEIANALHRSERNIRRCLAPFRK